MPDFLAPSPLPYDDLRAWLHVWYQARVRAAPDYSIRRFAEEIGDASETVLHGVMHGHRGLTLARARSWPAALRLSERDARYFLLLVEEEAAQKELSFREERQRSAADPEQASAHVAFARAELERVRALRLGLRRAQEMEGWPPPLTLAEVLSTLEQSRRPVRSQPALHGALWSLAETWLSKVGEDVRRLTLFKGLTQAIAADTFPLILQEIESFFLYLMGRYGVEDGQAGHIHITPFPVTQRLTPSARPPQPHPEVQRWNIYQYTELRACLTAWFEVQRAIANETKERFSYSTFAEQAGLSDRTLPNKLLSGREKLSPTRAQDFARGMGLDVDEERYFLLLVRLSHADPVEQEQLFSALRQEQARAATREITDQMLRLHTEWYQWVIYELASIDERVADPTWVAAQVVPEITPEQALRALRNLRQLDLLRPNTDGRLCPQSPIEVLKTGRNLQTVLLSHHQAMHQLTHDVMGQGLSLKIAPHDWGEVRAELSRFTQYLLGFCEGISGPRDQVIHVNVHFFPLCIS